MSQPRFQSVSALSSYALGMYLKRTSRLSWHHWKVRPLSPCLQIDHAMSAQCLIDIFVALDKPGMRRDREGTAEFKIPSSNN
ncbi:hypothetical protein FBU30_010651 [Linnemannia zychae]|nr:hypothetical protein FBU30_010651 [Linnemannia zychae]